MRKTRSPGSSSSLSSSSSSSPSSSKKSSSKKKSSKDKKKDDDDREPDDLQEDAVQERHWELILLGGREVRFEKDDIIIQEGDELQRIYQIVEGIS
jgi:hypothetical protein